MAIAVTGGLLMSMLLSLIVIPVIFTHVDDLNEPETADTEAHSSNDHTTITFKPELSKGGQGQRWLLWRALRQRRSAALHGKRVATRYGRFLPISVTTSSVEFLSPEQGRGTYSPRRRRQPPARPAVVDPAFGIDGRVAGELKTTPIPENRQV